MEDEEVVWIMMTLVEQASEYAYLEDVIHNYRNLQQSYLDGRLTAFQKSRQLHLDNHLNGVKCIHAKHHRALPDNNVVEYVLIYELDMRSYLATKIKTPSLQKLHTDGMLGQLTSSLFIRYSIESEWTQWS